MDRVKGLTRYAVACHYVYRSRRAVSLAALAFLLSTSPVVAATNVKDLRMETAASRAAVRETMRDERRKKIVERVQERLNNVNQRRTEHFDRVLDRLSTILDKIASRTEKAKAEGKDVAAIESAIAGVRTAISTAQSAVDAQKEKTYTITVTDDTTAKGEVEAVVKRLHEDLKAVYNTIVATRQAVHNVFQQIKTVVGSTE